MVKASYCGNSAVLSSSPALAKIQFFIPFWPLNFHCDVGYDVKNKQFREAVKLFWTYQEPKKKRFEK